MKKKFFVYSYNFSINEYFDDKASAKKYVEDVIAEFIKDIDEYGNTDVVYNPKESDLILCEIVAEMLLIPDHAHDVNTDYPYLESYN